MPVKLADRVADLERQMAELKREVQSSRAISNTPRKDAWRSTVGIFKDDPIYDDVVRLGRAWRRRQPKC